MKSKELLEIKMEIQKPIIGVLSETIEKFKNSEYGKNGYCSVFDEEKTC